MSAHALSTNPPPRAPQTCRWRSRHRLTSTSTVRREPRARRGASRGTLDRGHQIGRPRPHGGADPGPTRAPSRERGSAADQRGAVPRSSRRADERAAHARQRATRAAAEQRRVEGLRRREMERRRKNARARERYRQERLAEGTRVNKRTGMHALAIQVDPIAYRAVKADALQRGCSIPTVIGEILSNSSSRHPIASPEATGPRWRRTGEGRKANQHTRIDIDDDAWLTVRRDAVRHGLTIARWIGLNLETWARRGDVEES